MPSAWRGFSCGHTRYGIDRDSNNRDGCQKLSTQTRNSWLHPNREQKENTRRVLLVGILLTVASIAGKVDAAADGRKGRAGAVAGLEDGRISLAKVSKMMTSSVNVELAGSEDAFRSLLDFEWSQFYARSRDTKSSFVVCSEPGLKNAKRLRELAGHSRFVQTLSHKKGQPLCSIASLDRRSAALVAADGEGGTFSLEPMTHLAKLAPAVAVDPTPSALALSGYSDVDWDGEQEGGEEVTGRSGESANEDDGDNKYTRFNAHNGNVRSLRAKRREQDVTEGGYTTSHCSYGMPCTPRRRRASAAHEAAAAAALARAARPTTHRLVEHARKGVVDAIEITLAPRPCWEKKEIEILAQRWLTLADDQASLAKVLRRDHFWGQEREHHDSDVSRGRNGESGLQTTDSETQPHSGMAETEEEGYSQSNAQGGSDELSHAERKRVGWGSLLDHVHQGRGTRQWSLGRNWGRRSPGSCGFAQARYSVAPSGKKILIHKPHEIGSRDDSDGCLSALLAYVSMQPEVHYVTARRRSASMNYDAAWVTQSGVNGYTPLWNEKLQGQDEIIAVADTGLDLNHCHFREDDGDSITPSDWDDPITDLTKRKVVQYIQFVDDFDEEGGHGTHVAGTLAGAMSGTDAGDDSADGMAFAGQIAVFDFGDSDAGNALTTPDEVDEVMLQPSFDIGARVHSNSWDTVSNEYTSISKEVDEFVYLNPTLLVVFAAGNCGDTSSSVDLGDTCEDLSDDGGSVLSPAQGKNVVAVGSSESGGVDDKDVDTVSYFSSKGPTIDGRIKPDVVAPGDPTWSSSADPTGESCDMGLQTGTSMSTPVVAGNGALARQYFREGWYNDGYKNVSLAFEPSAALLKAVLVNSAVGMEYAGVNPSTDGLDVTLESPPDNNQGHGRVQMTNALNVNSSVGLFFKDWVAITEGETIEYEVDLYEDADLDKDLRITLVWTDPPADTGATDVLIHDLDLKVIAQSTGTEYYPNGYDEADSYNNVEKVTISDATELETYTIQITCGSLTADNQYFAVIANGEFIATNDPPESPEPSDWLDWIDSASSFDLTWQTGIIILLAATACCFLTCVCHRRLKKHRKEARLREERYLIAGAIAGRGRPSVNGRKMRPPSSRPQPVPGPVRQPSTLGESGRFTYNESWRRPGPRSTSAHSVFSERSSVLTGAGAAAPMTVRADSTAPSTPPQEACPECGLLLSDVVQLVSHVEAQHGGRATRNRGTAATPSVAKATMAGVRGAGSSGRTGVGSGKTSVSASSASKAPEGRAAGGPGGTAVSGASATSKTSSGAVRSKAGTVVAGASAVAFSKPSRPAATTARSFSAPRNGDPAVDGSGRSAGSSSHNSRSTSTSRPSSTSRSTGSGSGSTQAATISRATEGSGGVRTSGDSTGVKTTGGLGSVKMSSGRTRSASVDDKRNVTGTSVSRTGANLPRYGSGNLEERGEERLLSRGTGLREGRRNAQRTRRSGSPSVGRERTNAAVESAAAATAALAASLPAGDMKGSTTATKSSADLTTSGRGTRKVKKTSAPALRAAAAAKANALRDGNAKQRSPSAGRLIAGATAASQLPANDFKQGRPSTRLKDLRPSSTSPPALIPAPNNGSDESSKTTSRRKGSGNVTSSPSRDSSRRAARRPVDLAPMEIIEPDAARAGPARMRPSASGRGGAILTRGRTSSRRLNRASSWGSVNSRASSLDRGSMLSTRAFPAGADTPGEEEFGNEPRLLYPGIRRLRSTDDQVPIAERLTVDMLRHLGPTGVAYAVPAPVFSPVTPNFNHNSGQKPAYSPVDRARAEERDALEEQPRESRTKKFFRQLSG